MPGTLIQFKADRMDVGLDLQSARNVEAGGLSDGKSARYERNSGVMTGPGYLTSATVQADKRCDKLLEATVFPAIWAKFGTKVKYSEDAVTFYDTGATLTDDKDTDALEDGDGNILMSNQEDNPHVFPVSKLAVALAASDSVIDLGDADQVSKFSTTNPQTVSINGTDYTYTGTSGSTLTGVQEGGGAVTTAQTVDSLVVQQLSGATEVSTWTEEKGKILMAFEGSLFVMGVKNKEHIVYRSATATATNPKYFWDFDGNGTHAKFMPNKVTAGISGLGKAYIMMQKQVHIVNGVDVATGALLTQPISETYGAYNRKCVVDMDGMVAFMGQRRLIPITLALSPDATAAPFLDEDFDRKLRPWLESHDDSKDQSRDAYLKWDSAQKILKIGAVVDGALQTYIFDPQANGGKGAFAPIETRSVGDSTMFLGNSYFGHRDNGKLYQDDFGRTNDGIPIHHKWSTGRLEYEKGRQHMQAKTFEYEGWLTQNTEHTLRIYIDGSSTADFEKTYDFSDVIVSSQGTTIGTRGVGVNVPGGESQGVNVFPYKNNVLLRGLDGEDFRFEWDVSGESEFFQTNSYLFQAYVMRRSPRTFV